MKRLLDLFCGAGGASMGYHRAGFEVIGIDINPQPHYPFTFIQGDALDPSLWPDTDAITASPPCQAYSAARVLNRRTHPQLIEPTRTLLQASGLPYVIENVQGAPLVDPLRLCGSTLTKPITCADGTKRQLRRHRLFESDIPLVGPGCDHTLAAISVFGNGGGRSPEAWARSRASYQGGIDESREAMGIDWMNRNELSQAIPPTYTKHIGAQLLAAIR